MSKEHKIKDWKKFCDEKHWHDASKIFPMSQKEELASLVASIKEQGLLNPVVLLDNKVLDGRNRLLACLEADAEPKFVDWDEKGSPVVWVAAQNSIRRLLSSSQKACAALEALRLLRNDKGWASSVKSEGDRRIVVADMFGCGRHYISDIIQIDEGVKEPHRTQWLNQIKEGTASIPNIMRLKSFLDAQINPEEVTSEIMTTKQLVHEFLKMLTKSAVRLAYLESRKGLQKDKTKEGKENLERFDSYWVRLEKELTFRE